LVGDGQRRDFQLLPRLQRLGAFLVLIGQHQVAGARLQRVDHVLLERLTGLDRARIGAERFGLRTHGGDCGIDRRFRRGDIVVVEEPGPGDRRKPETLGVEVHAGDGQRASAILVEENLQSVAGKQVDTVVRGVAGELIDLRQNVVVVALQRGAGGRNWRDGVVDRGTGGDAEALSCRSCRPNAPFAELICLSKSSVAEEYYAERSGNRWVRD
jgi:hypothetical protein